MSATAAEKTRSFVSPMGCATALALVPIAGPILTCPSRARASVLFSFESAHATTPANFDHDYGAMVIPSFPLVTATQRPDGGVKIFGSFSDVTAQDVGDYGSGQIGYHFAGAFSGSLEPGEALNANVEFQVTVSDGSLTFLGLQFDTFGFHAEDFTTAEISNGSTVVRFIQTNAATSSTSLDYGWTLDFGIQWVGASPESTISITIPENSIDAWAAPVPEPALAALVLPAAVLMTRRRARQ